jgi:hypothetical protein
MASQKSKLTAEIWGGNHLIVYNQSPTRFDPLFLHQGISSSIIRSVVRLNNANTVKPAKLATLISRPRCHSRKFLVNSHYTTRYDTTEQNVLLWFWYVRIHGRVSPTAKGKYSVVGIGRKLNYVGACPWILLPDSLNACSVHDTTRHDTTRQSW